MLTSLQFPNRSSLIAVFQRNAIRSWTLLRPTCETSSWNDEGTVEIAANLACGTFQMSPEILWDSSSERCSNKLSNWCQQPFFCYVNSDVILMTTSCRRYSGLWTKKSRFLLLEHRWNFDVKEVLNRTGLEKDFEVK